MFFSNNIWWEWGPAIQFQLSHFLSQQKSCHFNGQLKCYPRLTICQKTAIGIQDCVQVITDIMMQHTAPVNKRVH